MFFQKLKIYIRYGLVCIIVIFISSLCCGQQESSKIIADKIVAIKKSNKSVSEKLQYYYYYKSEFDKNQLPDDSVKAEILHLIGSHEFAVNQDYSKAIYFTLASIKINTSDKIDCSKSFALNSYCNLASFYKSMNLFTKSLEYCDSTIIHANAPNISDYGGNLLDAELLKSNIYFHKGDYQKCTEQSTSELIFPSSKMIL